MVVPPWWCIALWSGAVPRRGQRRCRSLNPSAHGAEIGLALIRGKSRGDKPIGSLLFNFGGPGGSGV
ncbi:hypothetical protein ACWDR3_45365, partial [Streptomyces sp. NPDC001002]